MTPILTGTGLTKEFIAGLAVLQGVDFTLYRGEVVALMGENGAGKSTLASILAGILRPTSGSMVLDGRVFLPQSRLAAQHAGVAMVTQELNLIPTLSIAENLTLADMPSRFGVIDRRTQVQAAREALALVGATDLNPTDQVSSLGVAQRQLAEIAAGISRKCQILILDEPTAALSPSESEALFLQIDRLRDQGVCIVYISHRIEEVLRLADRVMVLRDGDIVETFSRGRVQRDLLIRAMVGRDVQEGGNQTYATDQIALELRDVRGVDLKVNRGEVVGLAGLVGAGRTELLRSIFGADNPSGEVFINGVLLRHRNPKSAVQAGLGFLTEDRKDQGLLLPQTIRENISLSALDRLSRLGIVRQKEEGEMAEQACKDLRIRCTSIEQRVSRLSGGNQQKVVLAKWLARHCQILLLDEPTKGIDVGARQEIYELIEEAARGGASILMASSDMNELMSLCDRIVVLSLGRITDGLMRSEFDQDRIMSAALADHGAIAR